jgi:glycopeptide antibiotics resistance protein
MTLRRAVVLSGLSAYVLFLLDLALLQFPTRSPAPNPIPLRSIIGDWEVGGRAFVVNFLGNILAFMPIGMIPPLARPRRAGVWQAALFSLSLSVMIEGVQYSTGRRVADVDDLLLNTAGGILGYYVLSLPSSRRPAPVEDESERPAGGVVEDPGGPH